MIEREKVIRSVKACAHHPDHNCEKCEYCDDNFWCYNDQLIKDFETLMNDRAADYEAWAKEIGVDTCINCRHASWNRNDGTSTCPIEHNFALVKDGYCHLFIRKEGTEQHGYPERNVPDREAGDGIPGGDDPVLHGPAME